MAVFTRFGAIVAALLMLPGAAWAQSFTITYKTRPDVPSPNIAFSAVVNTDGGAFYGPGNFLITGISGSRAGVAIDGITDEFSAFYFPAVSMPGYDPATYLDSFGFTYRIGGVDYQIYRNPGDSFYGEFAVPVGSPTGTLSQIDFGQFSITPFTPSAVPEPASWALMLTGFAAAGVAMRRRQGVPKTALA